jgi:hypothetical protein
MSPIDDQLVRMCKTMLDSLLASKDRNTLCLNLAEPGFAADEFVAEQLRAAGRTNVTIHREPSPTEFSEVLGGIAGTVAVVEFDDLDKSSACLDLLLEHVQKAEPGGKLVVVSRHWNSDNTPKERELRKHCLFYQQAAPARPTKRAD